MLAASAVASRPRPPGKVRRTSSKAPSDDEHLSPPPYADPRPLSSSSSSPNSRRVLRAVTTTTTTSPTIPDDEEIPSPTELRPAVHDVLSGRSREELQEMLLAAHNIIRKHEHDLTRSSTETQYLRDQNLELKSQFEKLSTRLPQSPSLSSLFRSRSISGLSPSEPGPSSPPMSPPLRAFNTPLRGHRSRPSVASPVVLAQLADQNAELVHKLDQLQEETNMHDQTGRRKLNKLEKEIDILKEDLERVQKRNVELEKEKVQKEREAQRNETEMLRRKLLREEKARAVRESLKRDSDEGEDIVRDFAPSSSTSVASFSSPARRSRLSTYGIGGPPIPFDLDVSAIVSTGGDLDSPGPSQQGTLRVASAGETAIVIQLLAKIEELENANREFIRQRAETEAKIQSATEEVSSMRQAYQDAEEEILQNELSGDFDLEEEEEEEWVDEARDAVKPSFQGSAGTSRFVIPIETSTATVRPQGLASPTKSLRSRSSKGSLKSPRTGPRGTGNIRMMAKRARKPLTQNMFLSPPTSPSMASSPAVSQQSPAMSSTAGSPGYLRPPNPHVRPGRSRFAAADFSGRSPNPPSQRSTYGPGTSLRNAPSFGDMGRYMGALGLDPPGRSLESELVGEYGEDWTINQAEISRQMFEASENGDDMGAASGDTSFASMSSASDLQDRAVATNNNPALLALSTALEPHNHGRLLAEDEHILPVGCLRDSPADTFYGLEQAVAARPQRWTDISSHASRTVSATITEPPDTTTATSPLQTAPPTSQRRGSMLDPWEANMYASDQERSEQPEGDDASDVAEEKGGESLWDDRWNETISPSHSKRDSALVRLNQTHLARRRRHSFVMSDDGTTYDDAYEIIPADGERRADDYHGTSSRYDPKILAANLRNSSLETFLEVWLILQFVMVLAVFVYSSVRQGPRAVMLGQGPGGGSPAGRRKFT